MTNVTHKLLGPIITGLAGLSLTDQETRHLANPLMGGVILFDRNYQDKSQLQQLISQIRAVAPSILITVDQEGGRVQRLKKGFTTIPSAAQLGRCYQDDPAAACDATRHAAHTMAMELRACDIDLSFAPVLDCQHGVSAVIGDRSFSSDPEAVIALAGAYIQGMKQAGMAAVGKHFPGHGAIEADTHTEFAEDLRPFSEIEQHDLRPFRELIPSGLSAVMPAHILFPEVDPQLVGFSSKWLQTILRQQLHFKGVIISDDLGMQAAITLGDVPTRVQAALNAGCDMVIIGNDLDALPQVLTTVTDSADVHSAQRRLQLKPTQLETTL